MERSEIQDSVFSPDSAALYLGYGAYSALTTHYSALSFFIHHSSFIVYFSPALRKAASWRSNIAGSLMGTLCL